MYLIFRARCCLELRGDVSSFRKKRDVTESDMAKTISSRSSSLVPEQVDD